MRDGDWLTETGAQIRGVLKVMVDAQWLPGGAAVIGTGGMWEFVAVGRVDEEDDTAPDVAYDAASLTKVMATWPLVGQAVAEGMLDLDAPMSEYLPVEDLPGGGVTTRQILTHTSRLNPVTWLERYVGTDEDLARALLADPLEDPGYAYVDRGFIVLGLLLERLYGTGLDRLAGDLWDELGMRSTSYGPLARSPGVAPTERRLAGAAPTWGVVHDEAAALMGGVAGHAGMFTTAIDLGAFAREVLRMHEGGDGAMPSSYVRASWQPHVDAGQGLWRGLGWLITQEGVVYHNGFTGTSLFLHPASGRYVGVLTNAVHYGRDRTGLVDLRAAARNALTPQEHGSNP
ncbi:CubicO group peptidase (beta-lactamase class C family) [Nocardiopsis sp. Huas11]|uniref:serine hydrolase domain-containing protein n=1 Tax=Nocardiopsis sp. Huas11 TaxID=2183912 RepID=UPI000EB19A50|nr:serine hydrolase domain-containing protein [Nocardiopsis sp. Huas11]RKS05878.1 CubicO group peptidase (beta-lactamase class C family) [Nocardiopsis sp. Huas11]